MLIDQAWTDEVQQEEAEAAEEVLEEEDQQLQMLPRSTTS